MRRTVVLIRSSCGGLSAGYPSMKGVLLERLISQVCGAASAGDTNWISAEGWKSEAVWRPSVVNESQNWRTGWSCGSAQLPPIAVCGTPNSGNRHAYALKLKISNSKTKVPAKITRTRCIRYPWNVFLTLRPALTGVNLVQKTRRKMAGRSHGTRLLGNRWLHHFRPARHIRTDIKETAISARVRPRLFAFCTMRCTQHR